MPAPETTPKAPPRSVADILGDLVHDATAMVKGEGRLLRAELEEAAGRVAKGTEKMAAGAIFLLLAAIVLIQAMVITLATWVGAEWASLIVGVVLLLIGSVLIASGRKAFSAKTLAPTRTLEQTRRDVRLTKDQLP